MDNNSLNYKTNIIKIIETGIDVSKVLDQLKQYPEDWGSQKKRKNTTQLDSKKYIVSPTYSSFVFTPPIIN